MFQNGISRWGNKVALLTGASAGIGAAIGKMLVENGVVVIGCARNISPMEEAKESYKALGYTGKLIPYKCDISKEAEISKMFEWIKTAHQGVDICINNAGTSTITPLLEISSDEMMSLMNLNIMGLSLCAKFSWMSMLERDISEGHIINVNSMSGHVSSGKMNFYGATKFAVTALTEGLRKEICDSGKRGIRVSSVSPGLVQTDLLGKSIGSQEIAKQAFSALEVLQPEDVAETIQFILAAPKHVEIFDIQMRPHGEIALLR